MGPADPRGNGNRARGFTLIEVVVSVAIVAIGLTVILEGINATARSASRQPQRTRAVLIAKESLDRLLLRSDLADGIHEAGERTTAEGTFSWEITTAPREASFPVAEEFLLLDCAVTVSWEARGGIPESVRFATLELRRRP